MESSKKAAVPLNWGVTYPSIIAVWSRWAPPQERARLVTIAFSGSYFSIVVTPPVYRFIANTLGWSYIFYISGIIGLIWFVVWWTVVKDKPEDDPHISTEELKYLRDNLDSGPNDYIPKHIIYPWDQFITSMPVWAIVVAHTCMSWGFTLQTELPVFMTDIYNYRIDETWLMFLPYLLVAVLMPAGGVLADWLRNSEVLTTTQEHYFALFPTTKCDYQKGRSTLDAVNLVVSTARVAIVGDRWKNTV
ncbi:hypothetical protein J6590_008648 [Homalodisca vitripennis]|nr:hypothetical protein J6590_008648 [Homalodisca vitripennis]